MSTAAASAGAAIAARLAAFTACLGLLVTLLFLITTAVWGLQLSISVIPASLTSAWMSALGWVCWRYSRPTGEKRFAVGAGVVLVLFAGGSAGGLICLVGQFFALPFIDPFLHQADLALGIDLNSVIRGVISVPFLPVLLGMAYVSSIPIVFISALIFAWSRREERAWELCFVFNLCLLVTAISAALIPATGPFHFLPIPVALQNALPPGSGIYALDDLFALRRAEHFVIDPTELKGVATFPSFHAMLALMTAAAWRGIPLMRVAMPAWQAIVILSTIPIGGHYAIDLIAGLICWTAVHALWQWALLLNRPEHQPFSRARTA